MDPGEHTTWEEVLTLTRLYRTALEHLGVIGLPKTTGKRGLRVPVRRGYRFDETRDWVEQLSLMIGRLVPDHQLGVGQARSEGQGSPGLHPERGEQDAGGGVLHASGRRSAGVAPVRWEELDDPAIRSDRWTIRTIGARVKKVGDLFAPANELAQELPL